MKVQWQVIVGIILALIIAIFAVINVDPVQVNFLFANVEWPLILIIIGSVLIGCLIIFLLNVGKAHTQKKQIKHLNEKNDDLNRQLEAFRKQNTAEPKSAITQPDNDNSTAETPTE